MKPMKFKSRVISTRFYIRPDDLQAAIKNNTQLVRYCKANGDYHADDPHGNIRLIALESLDGVPKNTLINSTTKEKTGRLIKCNQ